MFGRSVWYYIIIIHQSILYELLSNMIGSLLLYCDFILHWFTFYGAFKLLILHGFTFFGGFDWFVSSSWPTAVLQVDASQLTLLAVCCIWWAQIKKFVQTNSGRNSAEVSTTFVYVFKLHWFSSYFQEVHQLAHANWVLTGQTVKSRPVDCCWITRFYEIQWMERLCRGKDLKIGEYLVRSRSIKSGPSSVVKSYVGRSNQFS